MRIEETIHRTKDGQRYEYFPCDFDLRDIGFSYTRGVTLRIRDHYEDAAGLGRVEIYFLLEPDTTAKALEVVRYLNRSIRKCCMVYPSKGTYDSTVS